MNLFDVIGEKRIYKQGRLRCHHLVVYENLSPEVQTLIAKGEKYDKVLQEARDALAEVNATADAMAKLKAAADELADELEDTLWHTDLSGQRRLCCGSLPGNPHTHCPPSNTLTTYREAIA